MRISDLSSDVCSSDLHSRLGQSHYIEPRQSEVADVYLILYELAVQPDHRAAVDLRQHVALQSKLKELYQNICAVCKEGSVTDFPNALCQGASEWLRYVRTRLLLVHVQHRREPQDLQRVDRIHDAATIHISERVSTHIRGGFRTRLRLHDAKLRTMPEDLQRIDGVNVARAVEVPLHR